METNKIILDIETKGYAKIKAALKRKKGILEIDGPSPYREDTNYAQIRLTTTKEWNADKLDSWLCRLKTIFDFIGAVDVFPGAHNYWE